MLKHGFASAPWLPPEVVETQEQNCFKGMRHVGPTKLGSMEGGAPCQEERL